MSWEREVTCIYTGKGSICDQCLLFNEPQSLSVFWKGELSVFFLSRPKSFLLACSSLSCSTYRLMTTQVSKRGEGGLDGIFTGGTKEMGLQSSMRRPITLLVEKPIFLLASITKLQGTSLRSM